MKWLYNERVDTGEDEGWLDPDADPLEDVSRMTALMRGMLGVGSFSLSGAFTHTFSPFTPGDVLHISTPSGPTTVRVVGYDPAFPSTVSAMPIEYCDEYCDPLPNHLTWHEDRAFPSPRSGGCGGFPSQSLVVVPTPVLPGVITPGRTRSGLKSTVKKRYKPP